VFTHVVMNVATANSAASLSCASRGSSFSVLSPTGPFLAGSSSTSTEWGQAVVLAPGYAFFGSSSGLTVFDVKCGEMAVGTPTSMTVSGSYGFVAGGTGGVFILSLPL
jgi:hypothetical protein